MRHNLVNEGKTPIYFKYAINEIPIKVLRHDLTRVEGFIGCFMLTIFSVSLISQLLD